MSDHAGVRVLVVDDHPVIRGGVELLAAEDPAITVVGGASTGHEAIKVAQEVATDVILLDLRLPDIPAPELVTQLRRVAPRVKILLFTAFADHGAIDVLIEAGADGCLVKDITGGDFATAVRRVARGVRVVDPRLTGRHASATPELLFRVGLTRREYEVLRLAAMGHSNPEIADRLALARNTVKTYLQTAMQKLNARNRVEAIAKAHELRLL
ncbi:response regulator transcription factor [Amycolatopsis methanolica]|uniref:Response regulator, two-component system n=1 Tax=Amycolatopsis methanolica 239 TaxID=1068978 RepID=A0A076MQL7_AMYME|nr:response regulator transcription factor [Amycolatopsis methanolica]AIJ23183.1 response regulator, two-component system [Amycolatopsis methanolica 239]